MTLFSERNGYIQPLNQMKPGQITDTVRNLIWNVLLIASAERDPKDVTYLIWKDFYKLPVDSRPNFQTINGYSYKPSWEEIRTRYFAAPWFEVFDYVEFFCKH